MLDLGRAAARDRSGPGVPRGSADDGTEPAAEPEAGGTVPDVEPAPGARGAESGTRGTDDADLTGFVAQLADGVTSADTPEPGDAERNGSEHDGDGHEDAGQDAADPGAAVFAQIRARIAAGAPPAGLRRLAEALDDTPRARQRPGDAEDTAPPAAPEPAAVPAVVVPQQRAVPGIPEPTTGPTTGPRPGEDEEPARTPADQLTEILREQSFAVLEGADDAEVAVVAAALAREGLRVVVTAVDGTRLDELAVPTLETSPLTAAEQRELRLLLATATPARRARAGQDLPPPLALPPAREVRALCERATDGPVPASGTAPLDGILAGLDEHRLAALAAVAGRVRRALASISPDWQRPVLRDLVLSLNRATVDALLADAVHTLTIADRARDLPPVVIAGPVPDWAGEALAEYHAYLDGGGRSRRRFRSSLEREVQPILDVVRVDGEVPRDAAGVLAVIRHLELAGRLTSVDAGCRALGVPTPDDVGDLRALVDGLREVDATAGAVGQLRHDVLFLHPSSPVAVPDLEAAGRVADAVLAAAEHGTSAAAGRRLAEIVTGLVGDGPADSVAPEHEDLVDALRRRDGDAYSAAVVRLVAARREQEDQFRCDELLLRLAEGAPALAEAWESGEQGFVRSAPLDVLLDPLPAADLVDVVVLLGAEELGVERLLVAAVAPRLVAVDSRNLRSVDPAGPGGATADAPTLLGELDRAAAPVVGGAARPVTGRSEPALRLSAARPSAVPSPLRTDA